MQRSLTRMHQRWSFRNAVLAGMLLLPLPAPAENAPMPPIVGRTLSGEEVALPNRAVKQPVILVFGFANSARTEGEAWGRQLIALHGKRDDFSFFQVAMLAGAPRFTHRLIRRAIQRSVPSAYHPHMLVVTTNDVVWKNLLQVTDDASAYVALCSGGGRILWHGKGAGPAQFAALRAQLDRSHP